LNISAIQFKLLRKEKDPKFNIDYLEHYNLLLQVGFSDMQVCITDSRKDKIMLLEDYVLPGITNQEESLECLECLFDDHHLLLAGFWNTIKVLVKNKKFSLIPLTLFLEENKQDYIRLNTSIDETREQYFHHINNAAEFVNVFAVNQAVIKFLTNQTYPSKDVHFFHQSSALIQGFQRYFSSTAGKVLALYLDRFMLHISVIRDGVFLFYNQYPIKKFEDYFRFIEYVTQEYSIDPAHDHFYIWGYLSKNSKHSQSLKAKYPNLTFGDRPSDLSLGYVFDEIPEHQYFDLLSFNYLS